LFIGCRINTVKPETASGNLENQEEINQSSNNSQSSSTGSVEEPVIVDTEEPVTVYPQKWATGAGTVGDPWANNCLNTALTNVPAGGTIFLKAGYYLLASTLWTSTKSYNLIGEGRNKSIIVLDITDTYGIYIATDYCTLKGFTIDGASQTDDGSSLINIGYCDYTLMEDIEAKNSGSCGINLYGVNHSSLQNIYAHDNHGHGVHPGAFSITGKNMYNTYRDIYCWDNGHNGFDDWGNDIDVEQYNVYDNLQCQDNGELGISICNQKSGVLSNSFASGNGVDGIYLNSIKDFSINNCSAILSVRYGIYFQSSENINFTNVIVKNNGDGIIIKNCINTTLTTCQSYDDRDTPLQLYGIRLYKTNTGISLLNCKLTPNKEGEIYNPAGAVITGAIREFLLLSL
jgi:parallel beta-helix repeat protein